MVLAAEILQGVIYVWQTKKKKKGGVGGDLNQVFSRQYTESS